MIRLLEIPKLCVQSFAFKSFAFKSFAFKSLDVQKASKVDTGISTIPK
jgi:hypothetical protein